MNESPPGAILITGASSGIGFALAREFLGRNHALIATARRIESIRSFEGPETLLLELDVSDPNSISSAVEQANAWRDGVGILINNAGWGLMGAMSEIEISKLRSLFEVNLFGALRMCQAVIPAMIEKSRGLIVNIGSISGLTTTPFAGSYCASKAALHAMSDALRIELAPFGIRVSTVQPGAIRSSFGQTAAESANLPGEDSPYTGIRDQIAARAMASQKDGMSAEVFARKLADEILSKQPPGIIRIGPLSRKLPLLGRLPLKIRDSILSRKFGLDQLREN